MASQVEQIARGMIAGTDHVIDAVAGYVSTTLQPLPIARRRRIYRDLCIGGSNCAIRLLTRAAQRVRHRRARISLDFGSMAELAAASASGLPNQWWYGELRIGMQRSSLGLSSSRETNRQGNGKKHWQQQGGAFPVHDSAGIHSLQVGGILPQLIFSGLKKGTFVPSGLWYKWWPIGGTNRLTSDTLMHEKEKVLK